MQAYFAEREEARMKLRRLVEASTDQQGAREARTQLQAMKRSIGQRRKGLDNRNITISHFQH